MNLREKKIFFDVGPVKIEGLLGLREGDRAAVISHPHPLYGGTMYNNVVEALVEAFQSMGFTTLRFNFRGVGESTGDHDEGIGEMRDVEAAVSYVRDRGKTGVTLVGYSFGAWVNARLNHKVKLDDSILIAPPVSYFSFDFIGKQNHFGLVVCGDHDAFCEVETLQHQLAKCGTKGVLKIMPDTDHFLVGREEELKKIVKQYVSPPPYL
ncbi:MAG: alpha/beta fold hydrolase [Pseudomonadota bacterium]